MPQEIISDYHIPGLSPVPTFRGLYCFGVKAWGDLSIVLTSNDSLVRVLFSAFKIWELRYSTGFVAHFMAERWLIQTAIKILIKATQDYYLGMRVPMLTG